MGSRSTRKILISGQQILDGKGLKFFSTIRTGGGTNSLIFVDGLAGKFFNGTNWRSTISTGNIGTLPLTTTNDSSNVTGTTNLPSANHRYGVNLWTSIAYGDGLGDNYGFIAIGYFTPPTTGTYTFYTSSDDGSGVWIGELALEGATRTSTNAVVNNGLGVGQGNTKRSGTISLSGGVKYPIRIVHEEGTGGDNLTFSWSGPSITETTSLFTYFSTSSSTSGQLIGNYISSASSSLVLNLDAGNSASYPGTGTAWIDLGGYINNGTLQNSPTYSTANGGIFTFNGTNNEVTTTYSYSNPQTFSIGAWFKTSIASGKKIIGFESNQTGTASASYDRQIYIGTDGKLYFGIYDGAVKSAISPSTYNDNNWYYVMATYNGTTMTLYVNGVSVATNTASAAQNYSGYWRIAGYKTLNWTNGSDGYFTGSIAAAHVYSTVLSSEQVLQNFNDLRGRFGI